MLDRYELHLNYNQQNPNYLTKNNALEIICINDFITLSKYLWLDESNEMYNIRLQIVDSIRNWNDYLENIRIYSGMWEKIIWSDTSENKAKLELALKILIANIYKEWWDYTRFDEEIFWHDLDFEPTPWIMHYANNIDYHIWTLIMEIYKRTI